MSYLSKIAEFNQPHSSVFGATIRFDPI